MALTKVNTSYFKSEKEIDEFLIRIDSDTITDMINLAKASDVMGYTFVQFSEELVERNPSYHKETLLKLADAVVVKYLIAKGEFVFARESTFEDPTLSDLPVSSWDEYYYNICRQLARNSKCFSRKVGSLIVIDKTIVSTGYNGPPRGVPVCDKRWEYDKGLAALRPAGVDVAGKCPRHVLRFRSGEGLEWCPAGHGERNSIVQAAREGMKVKGGTMYMSCGIPCSPCLVEIINAGITEIVTIKLDDYYDVSAKYLLDTSGLKVRLYDFIKTT